MSLANTVRSGRMGGRRIDTQAASIGRRSSLAPLSILGGTSVVDVLGRLFDGSRLSGVMRRLGNGAEPL